jgi:hypothetical protein
MDCSRCELLESIRYDRIRKYCGLVEERKRISHGAAGFSPMIEAVECEVNEAWRELDLHRRIHRATASAYNPNGESTTV